MMADEGSLPPFIHALKISLEADKILRICISNYRKTAFHFKYRGLARTRTNGKVSLDFVWFLLLFYFIFDLLNHMLKILFSKCYRYCVFVHTVACQMLLASNNPVLTPYRCRETHAPGFTTA